MSVVSQQNSFLSRSIDLFLGFNFVFCLQKRRREEAERLRREEEERLRQQMAEEEARKEAERRHQAKMAEFERQRIQEEERLKHEAEEKRKEIERAEAEAKKRREDDVDDSKMVWVFGFRGLVCLLLTCPSVGPSVWWSAFCLSVTVCPSI